MNDCERFFQFMNEWGVAWWWVGPMRRKADGARGGLIGGVPPKPGEEKKREIGRRFADPALKVSGVLQRLQAGLAQGRGRFDMHTRESPSRLGGVKTALADDLDENQLASLLMWWAGPVAVLETSPGNHQAILTGFGILNKDEQERFQKGLFRKFGGDLGSTGFNHWHRHPGSPNWKREVVINGQPFLTRLIQLRPAISDFDEIKRQVIEMLGNTAQPEKAPAARARPARVQKDGEDNSLTAWVWTLNALKRGVSDKLILETLSTRFIQHHDPRDWPARTLWNAQHSLGNKFERFTSK